MKKLKSSQYKNGTPRTAPETRTKTTVALTAAELLVASELASVIQMPGQVLSVQDVMRIALANLAIANLTALDSKHKKQ